MHVGDLMPLLKKLPFKPFRIFVLEITSYEVRNPELAVLGPHTLTLFNPDPLDKVFYEERQIVITLTHISKLEILTKPTPTTNGGPLPPSPPRLPPTDA